MGLVLWIDQNTFATGLLEEVFKQKNLDFYSINEATDFLYLIDDLRPELIVLDAMTAIKSLDAFKALYDASEGLRHLPVVLLDETSELHFLENVVGKIKRPFDPFLIPEKLQQILANH